MKHRKLKITTENRNLPQAHKEMQDPEQKLNGTGFYEYNVIVQGRLASKSKTQH